MSNIKMIKEDVSISEMDIPVCDGPSDSCTVFPTHTVWLDIRASGGGHALGNFCETCAREFAERIKSSLPEDDGTQ